MTPKPMYRYKQVGCPIPPFLSQNDSASILSSDGCPQDYRTLQIICEASVLGVPQDTTFLTRDLEKYTKENFTEFYFCSHSSYNCPIVLIPSPDCYIYVGLLVDTHIGPILSHNSIRPYGHRAIFWGYGHIALKPYGSE